MIRAMADSVRCGSRILRYKLPTVHPFGLMRRYKFENADGANTIQNAASVQECTLPISKKYNRGLCAILGVRDEIVSATVLQQLI